MLEHIKHGWFHFSVAEDVFFEMQVKHVVDYQFFIANGVLLAVTLLY